MRRLPFSGIYFGIYSGRTENFMKMLVGVMNMILLGSSDRTLWVSLLIKQNR